MTTTQNDANTSTYHTPAQQGIRAARAEAQATNPRRQKVLRQARERLDDLATRLAQELGIETLAVRNLDRLDFHEIGVAGLKRVLQRAFVLGLQVGESEHPNVQHYIDAL